MFNWYKNYRINSLLVSIAGLSAEISEIKRIGYRTIELPDRENKLAKLREKLRQLQIND